MRPARPAHRNEAGLSTERSREDRVAAFEGHERSLQMSFLADPTASIAIKSAMNGASGLADAAEHGDEDIAEHGDDETVSGPGASGFAGAP